MARCRPSCRSRTAPPAAGSARAAADADQRWRRWRSLTGRSLTDISKRLGFDPHYVDRQPWPGRHAGLGRPEQRLCGRLAPHGAARWQSRCCDKQRFDPGIRLEDKRYSLSVHYRHGAQPGARPSSGCRALFETLSPPPRVVAGKYVFSLMPQDAAHKGSALEELMQQAGAGTAIYVGDDVTDEDVFRLRRPDVLTVRIEPHPDTAAEFYLPAMPDIVRLLDELVCRLARQVAGTL